MKTYKLLNMDNLVEITSGDASMLIEYIDMYMDHTTNQVNQLNSLFVELDWAALEIVAHNMRTNANYMGITALSEKCRIIEEYEQEDKSGLKSLICDAQDLFDAVKPELAEEKSRLSTVTIEK